MTTYKHVIDLLPDFLMGTFGESERNAIQSHLQSCLECRQEYESLSALWKSLGTLPEEKPNPVMQERFYVMLEAYQHGIQHGESKLSIAHVYEAFNRWVERWWPKQPAFQLGISVGVLVVGLLIGARLTGVAEQGTQGTTTEIAQLRGEVQAMSRLLAVSLMQQQSASERLRGVSMSSQMAQPDQQLIAALLKALNYDSSVNVRLAAIDALANYPDDSNVRQGIILSLVQQKSPMVQVALVDLLVRLQEKQSKELFQRMLKDETLNVAVKTRVQDALKQLL